ncbi:hypothetical protein L0991_03605 [Vibrio chagasii]|uniref:hypothetical protein n=1 Tax=Vibrio chagasii TaxID=170679 RepID=UPI0035A67913
MFVFEAEEKDIISGDITDREPELSLKKIRTKEMFYIEDGEIVRKLEEKDFYMEIEEKGLFQKQKGVELELAMPQYQVEFMHNNEEHKAFASQVSDLTNGKMHYGDFEHSDGFLINKESKLIIVLPEKALQERALFNQVKETFDFHSEKLVPSFKSDRGDISYGIRENNELGLTQHNGKTYRVYKENPPAIGDSAKAIMLELDTFNARFSVEPQSYEALDSEIPTSDDPHLVYVTDKRNDILVIVRVEPGSEGKLCSRISEFEHDCLKEQLSNQFNIDYDDHRIDDFIDVALHTVDRDLEQRQVRQELSQKLPNGLEAAKLRGVKGNTVFQTYRVANDPDKCFTIEVDKNNPDKVSITNERYFTEFCKNHRGSKSMSEFSSTIKADLKDHTLLTYKSNRVLLQAEEKERLKARAERKERIEARAEQNPDEQKQKNRSTLRR